MKSTAGPGKFRRGHQNDGVFDMVGFYTAIFQLTDQIMGMNDLKSIFLKCFDRFVISVISQHHAFF